MTRPVSEDPQTGGRTRLILFSLLCWVSASKACLQCDRTILLMHEDFVLSAPTVKDQIELKKICDHAYVTYKETSQNRKGVIDPTTLYRVKTEYQSEFARFLKMKLTGSLAFETIQIMEKGRKILEKHLDIFIPDELCPNKCGLLNRRVMDCLSCQYKVYTCPSPSDQQNCGEYLVHAEEGGQAVLDCFLPWHRFLLGKPEYYYSWAPGAPGSKQVDKSDFMGIVVTHDSSVVLNQLHVDEQGTYRCLLKDQNGTVFYGVTFLLTVAPLPLQTHQSVVTLPSLPRGDYHSPFQPTEDVLVPIIAMVTALCLIGSVGLTVVLGGMLKWQRAVTTLRRKRKGEKSTESTV
ncbi:unnamed protein product [Menidia menidia]|uniref:(Atlantic silverside) hypothetical protein n=1 Tax=Menidia menidia TaxID=238744 RepID=A0A8S4AYW4_9TELE|nr:unnamed protein product [Menidia menidia]